MLTQKRLKELFHYNPYTGIFRNKKNRGRAKVGNIAGTKRSDAEDRRCYLSTAATATRR